MTMDYGDGTSPTADMLRRSARRCEATAAADRRALRAARASTLERRRSVWPRIGATPMIGQNDVDAEGFTLDDAAGARRVRRDKGLGRVSMWSLNRDRAVPAAPSPTWRCTPTPAAASPRNALAFSKIFRSLPGRRGRHAEADSVDGAGPGAHRRRPDEQPVPGVAADRAVRGGYKVVWQGDVYQAKWSNQGVDPATVTRDQWETPWALIGPVGPDRHRARPSRRPPGIGAAPGTRRRSTTRAPRSPSTVCRTRPDGPPRATHRRPSSRSARARRGSRCSRCRENPPARP